MKQNETRLELLKLCRDICVRYGLTYFLFGEVLGSISESKAGLGKGEHAMLLLPAADLKKFCAYFAREAPRGVFLQNVETEPLCPFIHTKIRKDGTTEMPKKSAKLPMHCGISVDLYPYYPVEPGQAARRIKRACLALAKQLAAASYMPFAEKPSLVTRLMQRLPRRWRQAMLHSLLRRLEKGSQNSMQVYTPFGDGHFFWREALGEDPFFLSLGGENFRIPDRLEVFRSMTEKEGMPAAGHARTANDKKRQKQAKKGS